ncbi:MerR family transcriptional regulator [Pseudorhizobium marinum]|uniref:helix-turn-helix domain-containing protein n=1 Tax=Pseudorhizobium marinum TaxID=1496690 RepID=UPI000496B9C7|nr:helix-turn-helix domain-containing protein [Pseudorhizobium marinum]
MREDAPALGIGFYSAGEAARLLDTPVRNIRRWLGGYNYRHKGEIFHVKPLWTPQLPAYDDHIELGFRDLIELRFVQEFIKAGLGLKTIRHCLAYAKECVNDDHPFSTRRFQTDGKTIFLESATASGGETLLDLKQKQYTIKAIIERTFKDLDVENDAVTRWRPYKGKSSIIIDPSLVFGQPTTAIYNVPTIALAQAVTAEGSDKAVSLLYEVPLSVVRDAVAFEEMLAA